MLPFPSAAKRGTCPSPHLCHSPTLLAQPNSCWHADTSTRQSFNTLFGACPYCSSPITVKVA